jgi:hypothetical protein
MKYSESIKDMKQKIELTGKYEVLRFTGISEQTLKRILTRDKNKIYEFIIVKRRENER